ncbi:5'/3'-nucleotidase SurE [Rhodococcus pyridinivorans]|uniref:5'/3'-nucleotidase SurE n=1 Tax=Rhodococcus pyridinivorans TaxID=103816 RepID=UPI002283A8DD|nr:5'/3'-nucleotidase SurE [Rhodococcus pyridinivorans]WAL49275.1 5'/3'-nucleotidase SurE [Rhodococcus pyridinivorans]
MRILVTNDDGIDAPGLHAVAQALRADGHELTIVAPDVEYSGSGSSLGTLEDGAEIRYEKRLFEALRDVPTISVQAPPAFAVFCACAGLFGPAPDLVVSGINPGHNTGRMIMYSSTVASALSAAGFGVRGLAVSCGFPPDHRFDTAATVAVDAVRWMIEASEPRTVLNINVPDMDLSELKGVRMAPLASRGLLGLSFETGPESIRLLRHANTDRLGTGTDSALVRDGYVAVSALGTVRALEPNAGVAAYLEAGLSLTSRIEI